MISSNRNGNHHFQMQRNRNRLYCNFNRNQRLLSRLHKAFDYASCYIMPEMWFVYGRQNIAIERIYPLTECCHIYTHDDLSVYLFYEHERKMCSD